MAKVFVANASATQHLFMYRFIGQTRRRDIPIPMLSQAQLPDDFQPEDLTYLTDQMNPYGFVDSKELRGLKIFNRVFLMFSIGKEMTAEQINSLFALNQGYIDLHGREIRKQAAVAANNAILNQIDIHRQQGLETSLNTFEVEIEEEKNRVGDHGDFAEGYRVSQADRPERPTSPEPRGRRGKK